MLIDCFSYKIFKTNLNFSYTQELTNIVSNIGNQNLKEGNNLVTNAKSFFHAYEHDTRFQLNNINIIDLFCSEIEIELNSLSKLIGFDNELEIRDMWFVEYNNNEKCLPHTHANFSSIQYCLSGIYYLSFDSNEHQTTTFYNDKSLSKSFTPQCEEGDLLIYPADVWHGYTGTVSSKKRIVVPFDVKTKFNIKYN